MLTYTESINNGTTVRIGFIADVGYTAYIEFTNTTATMKIEIGSFVAAEKSWSINKIPKMIVVSLALPTPESVEFVYWEPGMNKPEHIVATSSIDAIKVFRSVSPFIRVSTTSNEKFTVSIERVALFLGTFMHSWANGLSTMSIGPELSAGSEIMYVTVNEPGTYIMFDSNTGKVKIGKGDYSAPLTLVGFRGFTLSVSYSGTNIQGLLIGNDVYPLNVPYGTTFMVLIDIGTKTVNLVSITPPEGPTKLTYSPSGPAFTVPASWNKTEQLVKLNGTENIVVVSALVAVGLALVSSGSSAIMPVAMSISSAYMAVISAALGLYDAMALSLVMFTIAIAWWYTKKS